MALPLDTPVVAITIRLLTSIWIPSDPEAWLGRRVGLCGEVLAVRLEEDLRPEFCQSWQSSLSISSVEGTGAIVVHGKATRNPQSVLDDPGEDGMLHLNSFLTHVQAGSRRKLLMTPWLCDEAVGAPRILSEPISEGRVQAI